MYKLCMSLCWKFVPSIISVCVYICKASLGVLQHVPSTNYKYMCKYNMCEILGACSWELYSIHQSENANMCICAYVNTCIYVYI